jgi:hypothetical protein
MADLPVSALPVAAAAGAADLLYLVQSGASKQITAGTLFAIPPAIGGTSPAAGAFTTVSATGNISTTGASSILQVLAGASVQIQNTAASANWNFSTSGTGLTLDSPQLGTFSISNPVAITGTLSTTGVATFAAGTVALPSITTSGDTNTGVYFPAADTVGITAGGTQRGAFSSTGLAVTGALSASGTITANNVTALIVSNGYQELYRTTNDATSLAHLLFYRGSGVGASAGIYTIGDAANGVASLGLTISGTTIAAISSTGLAVTGTLSTTGVATFPAGTVALPSITTSGDTNTGVYFPAADTVGVTNGGTERGRFTTTGFAVTGTASATGSITSGTTSTAGSIVISDNQNNGSNVLNTITSIGINSLYSELAIKTRCASTTVLSTPFYINSSRDIGLGGDITASALTGAVLVISGSPATERMRIDSSGNVGIGTASPSASAILDAQSTTKGVRMPNMTTVQKNAIASPAAGLMVYDTTLAKLCVYTTAWETITSV